MHNVGLHMGVLDRPTKPMNMSASIEESTGLLKMEKVVALVDVMHGIEKLVCLASCIKADAIHGVVPTPIYAMQPLNDAYSSLEPVVSITNIKHLTRKELKMRV